MRVGVLAVVQSRQDEHENVGLQTGGGVPLADAIKEPAGHDPQHAVRDGPAQPGIRGREAVHVDVHDADAGPVAVRLRDRDGEPVGQKERAREPRERVAVDVVRGGRAVIHDLVHQDLHGGPSAVRDRRRRALHLGGRAVDPPHAGREPDPGRPRRGRARRRLSHLAPLVRVEEVGEGAAGDRGRGLQPEQLAQGRVREDDAAGRLHHDRLGGGGGEALVALLALAQRLGGPPPLPEVPHRQLEAAVREAARADLDLQRRRPRPTEAERPREVPSRGQDEHAGHVVDGLVGLDQLGQRDLEEGGAGVGEEGRGFGVGVGDPAVAGDEQHVVSGLLGQEAVLLVALAQRVHHRSKLVREAGGLLMVGSSRGRATSGSAGPGGPQAGPGAAGAGGGGSGERGRRSRGGRCRRRRIGRSREGYCRRWFFRRRAGGSLGRWRA
jgi:hypothetical protein